MSLALTWAGLQQARDTGPYLGRCEVQLLSSLLRCPTSPQGCLETSAVVESVLSSPHPVFPGVRGTCPVSLNRIRTLC